MTEPVGIAVIGLGYWGPNLVRNLHELPEARLVVVADRRQEALDRLRRRYPGVAATTSMEDVLRDPAVEAVVIATPISTHFELALAALEEDKHVFVEKPLAASSVEAATLMAVAAERRLTLMPGHTFLYSPPVNLIRDLIQSGSLGEIYSISTSRVNLGLHQSDVSVIWDLAPHDFSILRYILDATPVRVSALSRDCIFPGTPDVAFVHLEYGSGLVANVELSWLAPSKLRRTTIIGSSKMIVYDDVSNEPVRVFDSGVTLPDPETFGQYRLSYRTGDIVSPHVEGAEPLFLEMEDFCRAVRTASTPVSSCEVGIDVVRTIEAADESLRSGASWIALGPTPSGLPLTTAT